LRCNVQIAFVMAMTSEAGERAMNREHEHEDLIDLGAAIAETKGGPFGVDDHRASLMNPDSGLTAD